MRWSEDNGFTLPLSALVIYDSFIHSGSILWPIRMMFAESPPANNGDERAWIKAYVNARHRWLENHSRPAVRRTVYRTECFKREIARENWDLTRTPINANGVNIKP
jgi:chitosanase